MRKVFDVYNKEDMDLLWSILPDSVVKIGKNITDYVVYWRKNEDYPIVFTELNIDLHDKTEITRPVKYEDMIGCVGWFSDNIDDKKAHLGILKAVSKDGFKYKGELHDWWFEFFTPVKKSELKFYGE